MEISSTDAAPAPAAARPPDHKSGLQAFLLLDAFVRLFIWSSSFALTTALFTALDAWPRRGVAGADLALAWHWGQKLTHWVVAYNAIYLAHLLVLRILLPTPETGVYSTARPPSLRRRGDRQLIVACLIGTLTKARYEAPFPAFLVFHFANLPPLNWLMNRIFGPRSRSCYVSDPLILDPSYVEIGRNVVIGSNASIAGHIQVRDMIVLKKTVIEDEVLIGANAIVFGGVRICRGAMIAAGSVVPPYTTVGENEYWSGVPATKVRDLPPVEQRI